MGTVLKTEGTLKSQENRLKRETSLLRNVVYLEIAVGVLLVGYGFYAYFSTGTMLWLIAGGILLYFALAHYYRRRKNRDATDKISAGRSGENFVTKILREDLPADYYILNDLTIEAGSEAAQNDHVVVSSGGLFLVETKAYGGHLSGTAEADYWTQSKDNGETNQVTNPIKQSRYHVRTLEKFLSRRSLAFDGRDLHWYVAIVNKDCTWDIAEDDGRVDYAWNLPGRIQRNSSSRTHDDSAIRDLLRELNVTVPEQLQ